MSFFAPLGTPSPIQSLQEMVGASYARLDLLLPDEGPYQARWLPRVFRTEAVRAWFKRAWHELMYYDNALMRAEAESAQGRLL